MAVSIVVSNVKPPLSEEWLINNIGPNPCQLLDQFIGHDVRKCGTILAVYLAIIMRDTLK
jgi:hypothetical protein